MSISGAIASSSAGRGPRGSIQGPVGYRRPSQAKDPGDMSSGKNTDKKKDPKAQNSSGSKSTKSTCVLLVAMGMMAIWSVMSCALQSSSYFHGNGG